MALVILHPIVQDYILPFLLVFTIIFAILEKTQLLGGGKKQINAIIGLIVGLALIAFPFARNMIVLLMPYLAVVVVILLVFMLLYGFTAGKKDDVLNKGLKILFGILIGVSLLVMIIYATGYWDEIYDFLFKKESSSQIWINVLIIVVLVGGIAAVVSSKKSESEK